MRFLVKIYNFIMGLIGLIVLGAIAFFFFASKWEEFQDQQYEDDREDVVNAVAREARERGLGDLDQLRQQYLEHCPTDRMLVLEGDTDQICAAMADALLAQSQSREMTMSDYEEIGYRLCALDAEYDGGDPEDYCDRDEVAQTIQNDALAIALCAFDRAWVFDTEYENSVSKRGLFVYAHHEQHVDCAAREFKDYYYEGFFDSSPEDEDWPPIIDRLYDALESEKHDGVVALLDAHEFGKDERTDFWILSLFLDDSYVALLPEVLDRNGGKVNFDINYYNQPLSLAIDAESSKAALALLDAGADPIRPHDYGVAPIVDAAGNGMLDVVKALVEQGADVDGVVGSESLDFAEPLRWASWNSHEQVALWLLRNGAQIAPDDPTRYPQWSDESLLEYAVTGGDFEVVQTLVQMGATNNDSLRLLENAAAGGSPDVLKLLFDQGYELPEAKYHDRIYDHVVDAVKEEGDRRVEDGVRMFELLLDQGLDLSELRDSGWNYGHQAVIHYAPSTIFLDADDDRQAAVHAERLRFVKRVIDEVLAAGIDIDQLYESETMLMKAADGGQPELSRYLLDHGADAALTNEGGHTALDIAVREGRRLSAFWEDKENVRIRYSEVIEILGGTRDMLNPPEESPDETQSANLQ